eukprot:scaffold516_cov175-Amphora_coffeaeformis.AAC.21
MPRINQGAAGAPPPSSSSPSDPSSAAELSASQFLGAPLREEDILSLLAQRHRQQQSLDVAVAAVAAGFPSSLGTPHLLQTPHSSPTGAQVASPMEAFIAASQHQSFGGLSAATVLELARQRPDMLASLQSPPPLQLHAGATAEATAAVGTRATSPPQPTPKRQRREKEEEDKNSSKQNDEEGKDEHDEMEEEESGSPYTRPRKRAMFQIGDLGKSFSGDDVEETEEDAANAWTKDLHRSLVEGIFSMGIRHASPSVLLDLMSNVRDFPLTSERVKSHLQKYRKHAYKSQADFMQEYDTFLQRALSIGSSQSSSGRLLPTANVVQIMGQEEPLYGGDAAAAATYDMLYKISRPKHGGSEGQREDQMEFDSAVHQFLTPSVLKKESASLVEHCHGQTLEIPHLAPEEKESPLGLSLTHIVDTFKALTNELGRQRSGAVGGSCLRAGTNVEPEAPVAAAPACAQQQTYACESMVPTKPSQKVVQNTAWSAPRGRQNLEASKTAEENEEKTPAKARQVTSPRGSRDMDQIETLVDLMYQRRKGLDYTSTPLTTRD